MNWLPLRSKAHAPVAPPGLHAYVIKDHGGEARVHLRIETDGRGLLLVNANRAYHLNETAAYMAWLDLEGIEANDAVRALRRRFRVSRNRAQADFARTKADLEELLRPDGACPIHGLDLEISPPFATPPSAPYRMDLALTYRCNANCAHCYNARPRNYPELDTQTWLQIIDLLWEIGVPHICFTGGEATLRPDLPQLIAHAESKGQITGLLSNGRLLADADFLASLCEAGLDHVQITLESADEAIHDRLVRAPGAWRDTVQGIRNALEAGLYVMTNTTLLAGNAATAEATIDFLADLGVPTVGFNALIYAGKGEQVGTGLPERDLAPLLERVKARTEHHGQRLIWYTPTQYCHFDPVQMDLGIKACTAAQYNMCIEPDGAVIPCQSFYEPLGRLPETPWDEIWNHELARWIRERRYVPEACQDCSLLPECGGGCPLTLRHQSPSLTIEELVLAGLDVG